MNPSLRIRIRGAPGNRVTFIERFVRDDYVLVAVHEHGTPLVYYVWDRVRRQRIGGVYASPHAAGIALRESLGGAVVGWRTVGDRRSDVLVDWLDSNWF